MMLIGAPSSTLLIPRRHYVAFVLIANPLGDRCVGYVDRKELASYGNPEIPILCGSWRFSEVGVGIQGYGVTTVEAGLPWKQFLSDTGRWQGLQSVTLYTPPVR